MSKTKKKFAYTGGTVAAEFLRQVNPDVMAAYPITPQTPIIETFAKMKADGLAETEIIPVESEHSAMSATIGAAAAGARAVTATSSQGLALMHEMLYIASGLRLPILMYVSARALSAPLNIHGEHGDVMGSRDAGWIQLFSESVQEVYDLSFIAMKLAEKVKLPAMAVMDGFHTSHTTERAEIFSDEEVKKFIGEYQPENYLLNIDNPVSFGALALQNSYMDFKIQQDEAFDAAHREFGRIAKEFKQTFGKDYDVVEQYRLRDADRAIVIMGSVSGSVKDAVDRLRAQGEKVGMLKIRLFRPFPHHAVAEALAHVKSIAVLDRAISHGTRPPLYQEVLCSMYNVSSMENRTQKRVMHDTKYMIQSYIYGLGGRDTFEKDIEQVFEELEGDKIYNQVKFIC